MQSMVSSYNLIACAFLRILFGIQVESVDDLTVLVTIGIVHLYPVFPRERKSYRKGVGVIAGIQPNGRDGGSGLVFVVKTQIAGRSTVEGICNMHISFRQIIVDCLSTRFPREHTIADAAVRIVALMSIGRRRRHRVGVLGHLHVVVAHLRSISHGGSRNRQEHNQSQGQGHELAIKEFLHTKHLSI